MYQVDRFTFQVFTVLCQDKLFVCVTINKVPQTSHSIQPLMYFQPYLVLGFTRVRHLTLCKVAT